MQASKYQQIKKLARQLKKLIKNNIIDIIIIGSYLKNKLEPRDLDIIVLFKEKNFDEVENTFFKIKEIVNIKDVHIEPIFVDTMFKEKILLTILHEGFSIKQGENISRYFGLKSYSIFQFSLGNLSKIMKVKFAQTLYGRKKDGLLYNEKGIPLGFGSFMIKVESEEIFKELMKEWKIKYSIKRAFVND